MTGDRLRVVVMEAHARRVQDACSVDPTIEIVGTGFEGLQGIALVKSLRPDVVIIDAHILRTNAADTTRHIMSEIPTPIVMIADDTDPRAIRLAMEAQLAGALATAQRPTRIGTSEFAMYSWALVDIIRRMAGLKLVRRWGESPPSVAAIESIVTRRTSRPSVIAIGASTGGPAAIHRILSDLPSSFPIPILITQHISPGFVDGMVRWLDEETPLRVKVGEDGDSLHAGVVYLAADGYHMTVARNRTLARTTSQPVDGHCPSASVLFHSVADTFAARAIAVILTGMGTDGVTGLAAIRSAGGRVIAQNRESCAVYGMPQAAIAAGITDAVLPLERIAIELKSALGAERV